MIAKLLIIFLAALLPSFSAQAADDIPQHEPIQGCTELWCQEGFTIDLDESKDWPAGKYNFTITADGEKFHCKSKLPFASCEEEYTRCDTPDITIGLSGCALPPVDHKFYMLRLNTIPKQFSLVIEHQGGKKFTYATPVSAQCSHPNGPECDEKMCCSAGAKALVKWK